MTEDAIEPIWQRYGVLGLARLLADIAIRIPIEHLAELRQDVRYGLRMLASSPGFTLVALVSLSLGIAVATCAYSEVNGLVLRDLPGVPKPQELVCAGSAYVVSQLQALPRTKRPVLFHGGLCCARSIRRFAGRSHGTDLGAPGHALVLLHFGRPPRAGTIL